MPCGVNNNLIPGTERSHEEASENGKKGGIESGKSRRRNKAFKERLEYLLKRKPNIDSIPNDLRSAITMSGIDIEDIESNDELLLVAAFTRALSDTNTLKYIDEIMGRNPQLEIKKRELRIKEKQQKIYEQRIIGKIDLDALIDDDIKLADGLEKDG